MAKYIILCEICDFSNKKKSRNLLIFQFRELKISNYKNSKNLKFCKFQKFEKFEIL